jgi:hypothetical protein
MINDSNYIGAVTITPAMEWYIPGNLRPANLYAGGTAQGGYVYSAGNIDAVGSIQGAYIASSGNIDAGGLITSNVGRIQSVGGQPSIYLHVPDVIALGMWSDAGGSLNIGQTDGSGTPTAGWARLGNDQGFYAGGGLHPGTGYGANQATFFADGTGGYIRFFGVIPYYYQLGLIRNADTGASILVHNTPDFPTGGGAWNCDHVGNTGQAGQCAAYGFPDLSDARLKTAIEPWAGGLAEVLAINPVIFEFAPREPSAEPYFGEPGKKHVGVVAQDVQAVLPHAVHTVRNGPIEDETLAVTAATVTYACVNAIKELTARVVALEGGSSGVLPSQR